MIYPAARFLMRELLQQLLCCAGKSRCLLPRARLKISHTVDCLNTGIAFLPVQVPEIACAATPLQGSNELTALPFRCCHRNDPKRPLQWYELEALSQHGCIRQQFLLRSSGVEIPESKVRRCTADFSGQSQRHCSHTVHLSTDATFCKPMQPALLPVFRAAVIGLPVRTCQLQFHFCFWG